MRYLGRLPGLCRTRPHILTHLDNEWWTGKTGTGKSKKLWEMYPDHFAKSLNKWWDHYNGEETVAIEEWSPKNELSAANLKIWSDRYPFTGEIKGGVIRNIRPVRIIVLSNFTMEECFHDQNDLEPLKRRFKQVHFNSL